MSREKQAGSFTLTRGGLTIEVIEYGARLRRCLVPDVEGRVVDVAPGFECEAEYRDRGGSIGAVLGRYGNRIGFGRIALDGRTYELSRNDGPHTMHGGAEHFGTRRWKGRIEGEDTIRLTLLSPDGDQGWPGTVRAQVRYRLGTERDLLIEMKAVPDRATYLNLIFHGYWNLAGHSSGTVRDHLMRVAAEAYLTKDADGLSESREASVVDTPFDFRIAKPIGRDIGRTGRGYADNLCLATADPGEVSPALRLLDPGSGRAMTIATDQPGVQVFTGNSWTGLAGKDGALYRAHDAIALETQAYPNTPNTPAFRPRPVEAGQTYRHRMAIRFHALTAAEQGPFMDVAP